MLLTSCLLGVAFAAEPTLPVLLEDAPVAYPRRALERAVDAIAARDRPLLIELRLDPNEVPRMRM